MKILVVDDERDIQFLFEQKFRNRDREMEFAFLFQAMKLDFPSKSITERCIPPILIAGNDFER
jgi:hypothetical protein